MTKLQNSIAHRKYTRYTRKQTLSMIELLKARKMALDLANELARTPGGVVSQARHLYEHTKEEAKCK